MLNPSTLHPVELAGQAAALDLASGGRAYLGLVAGAWLDRLGRAPIEEAMGLVREITRAGGVVVPADGGGQPIQPDDPEGETNLVLQLQIARQHWATTAKRFRMSRQGAIAEGKAMGCPFGYRYNDPTPKPRSSGRGIVDSRLVPSEGTAHIIPELFERKAVGATWLELARWLDQVAPKANGRHWQRSYYQHGLASIFRWAQSRDDLKQIVS